MERERERNLRERNTEGWTTVSRRSQTSKPPAPTATKTIYVDYLPIEINLQTIRFIFLPHGDIADIVIPPRVRENHNHRFAFVKFLSTHSLLSAILHENGRRIGNHVLRVNPAKYDTPSPSPFNPPLAKKPTPVMKPPQVPPRIRNAVRDHRTYKEASIPTTNILKPHNPSHHDLQQQEKTPPQNPPSQEKIVPNQILEPCPKLFVREMSNLTVMNSRVLGEETERVREQLDLVEFDGDQIITITGSKNAENEELLKRSVIAVANSSSSSEIILNHILSEGVNCLRVKSLGGMMHLITFDSLEDKEAMVASEWLLRWFMDIRDVNGSNKAIWRTTWLTIYGVPLDGWCYENFSKIGSIYGRVLSVEYARLDYARVMIITDCFFQINNPVILSIDGRKSKIFILEEYGASNNLLSKDQVAKNGPGMPEKEQPEKEDSTCSFEEDERSPSPMIPVVQQHLPSVKETEHSPIDLGNDDINHPFNDTFGTPQKTAKKPSSLGNKKPPKSPTLPKTQQTSSPSHGLSSQKQQDKIKTGPSPRSETSLPSLSNLNIIPSPTKSPTFSKPTTTVSLNTSPQTKTNGNSFPYCNPPIISANPFSPISGKNSSKPNSSSDSISGPSVPPGFELFIPSPLKALRESQRARKLQKKKDKRRISSSQSKSHTHHPSPPPPFSESYDAIATEIIELGLKMGMNFNGPLSDLQSKIKGILMRQNQEWASSH